MIPIGLLGISITRCSAAFMFPWFAAIYYYFPKVTGRKMNEFWGKLHFWLMVPGLPGDVHLPDADRPAGHASSHCWL